MLYLRQLFATVAIVTAFSIGMVVTPVLTQNATGNVTTASGNVTGGNVPGGNVTTAATAVGLTD